MLRVGISGEPLEPALRHGYDGIGVYTEALTRYLPEHGVAMQPYVYASGRARQAKLEHSKLLPNSYLDRVIRRQIGMPGAMQVDCDVFHFTDYHVVKTRCPSVATVHDAIPLKYPEWVSARLRSVKNLVLRRMVGQADLFIAVSRFAVDELEEYFGLPSDRIRVVPCGIDADWLTPAPEISWDPASTGARAGHFLFVGTLQPRKNVDRIIDAYLALPEAIRQERQLVIIGKPGWRCEQTVARLQTQTANGKNQILWLQNIGNRAQLRAMYNHAGALVFPTLYEGFGIPVVEAFACGLPVITSTAASLPEVAGDAAVLVNPEKTSEIADAMQRIALDSSVRDHLSQAGRARAATLTWHQTAAALAEVYRELAPR